LREIKHIFHLFFSKSALFENALAGKITFKFESSEAPRGKPRGIFSAA
jgi:hypothetical protein